MDSSFADCATENIARAISSYLTSETGVTVAFESAIVPKWKDSRISFKNVYISRRPAGAYASRTQVRDGIHKATARLDVGNHPAYHDYSEDDEADEVFPEHPPEEPNYSLFDLDVDSIDVTFSLWRWLDGKGLIKDATVKGVRGVLGLWWLSLAIIFGVYQLFLYCRPSIRSVGSIS